MRKLRTSQKLIATRNASGNTKKINCQIRIGSEKHKPYQGRRTVLLRPRLWPSELSASTDGEVLSLSEIIATTSHAPRQAPLYCDQKSFHSSRLCRTGSSRYLMRPSRI